MLFRPKTTALAALAATLAFAASAAAAPVGVWRAGLDSEAQRAQIVKLSGDRCGRGGSDRALRILLGKRTPECAYRTPVVGRDLEVQAVSRLLSGTPKAVRQRAYLALNVRAGKAGAHYQLAVFPLQRKAQLRKTFPDGRTKYLQVEQRVRAVKGVNRANKLRLRAFNVTSGPNKGECRILAFVGNQRVAAVNDRAAGDLQGRTAGFAFGVAHGGGKGLVGSVEDAVVRVPNPFE